ncbi:hypothetical protein [Vagococcus luciliae]|nr:hypothetical protein [Vagococcus luciliae]
MIKVGLYCYYFILLYSFIKANKYEIMIIEKLVWFATLFSILAFFIYVLQLISATNFLNVIWMYLRQDELSYFLGSSNLIRLRGLTNEPAHFGIINCFVLAVAYLNKIGYSIPFKKSIVLIVTTVLSFSLSSFPLLLGLILIKIFKTLDFKFLKSIKTYFFIIVSAGIFFSIWDKIYESIIARVFRVQNNRDNSAKMRLSGSWDYSLDYPFMGYGINNSPGLLFNNYAYILTELGLIPLAISIVFTIWLFFSNVFYGLYFIYFMFQQGGYLSIQFWCMVAILIFTAKRNSTNTI